MVVRICLSWTVQEKHYPKSAKVAIRANLEGFAGEAPSGQVLRAPACSGIKSLAGPPCTEQNRAQIANTLHTLCTGDYKFGCLAARASKDKTSNHNAEHAFSKTPALSHECRSRGTAGSVHGGIRKCQTGMERGSRGHLSEKTWPCNVSSGGVSAGPCIGVDEEGLRA